MKKSSSTLSQQELSHDTLYAEYSRSHSYNWIPTFHTFIHTHRHITSSWMWVIGLPADVSYVTNSIISVGYTSLQSGCLKPNCWTVLWGELNAQWADLISSSPYWDTSQVQKGKRRRGSFSLQLISTLCHWVSKLKKSKLIIKVKLSVIFFFPVKLIISVLRTVGTLKWFWVLCTLYFVHFSCFWYINYTLHNTLSSLSVFFFQVLSTFYYKRKS